MLEKIFEKTSFMDIPVIIITSLAIVSFWRGVWGLMDLYLFPRSPELSFTISIFIGLGILFLIASYRKRRK